MITEWKEKSCLKLKKKLYTYLYFEPYCTITRLQNKENAENLSRKLKNKRKKQLEPWKIFNVAFFPLESISPLRFVDMSPMWGRGGIIGKTFHVIEFLLPCFRDGGICS